MWLDELLRNGDPYAVGQSHNNANKDTDMKKYSFEAFLRFGYRIAAKRKLLGIQSAVCQKSFGGHRRYSGQQRREEKTNCTSP